MSTCQTRSRALAAGTLFAAAFLLSATPGGLAAATPAFDPQKPPVDASAKAPEVRLEATNEIPSTLTDGNVEPVSSDSPWVYRTRESSCEGVKGATACMWVACASPDEVGYLVERRARKGDGDWHLDGTVCIGPEGPILTPGRVLEEVRRIGLPSMSVEAPPETLVNYDTVVYTEAEAFSRTVNLLGFTVDLEATPSQFRWSYDDGSSETTTTAGRPYPAKDVTHTWDDAHRTFHPSVDVTYQIRFRVDGGEWQSLADTITIDGPEGDVRIREATGMLADMR